MSRYKILVIFYLVFVCSSVYAVYEDCASKINTIVSPVDEAVWSNGGTNETVRSTLLRCREEFMIANEESKCQSGLEGLMICAGREGDDEKELKFQKVNRELVQGLYVLYKSNEADVGINFKLLGEDGVGSSGETIKVILALLAVFDKEVILMRVNGSTNGRLEHIAEAEVDRIMKECGEEKAKSLFDSYQKLGYIAIDACLAASMDILYENLDRIKLKDGGQVDEVYEKIVFGNDINTNLLCLYVGNKLYCLELTFKELKFNCMECTKDKSYGKKFDGFYDCGHIACDVKEHGYVKSDCKREESKHRLCYECQIKETCLVCDKTPCGWQPFEVSNLSTDDSEDETVNDPLESDPAKTE